MPEKRRIVTRVYEGIARVRTPLEIQHQPRDALSYRLIRFAFAIDKLYVLQALRFTSLKIERIDDLARHFLYVEMMSEEPEQACFELIEVRRDSAERMKMFLRTRIVFWQRPVILVVNHCASPCVLAIAESITKRTARQP